MPDSAAERFQARLQAVIDLAETLKLHADLEGATGFAAPSLLLMHYASRLAWANNYLTVAALELVAAVSGKHEKQLTGEEI